MNNNKNYRIMKFFETADKSCQAKGYVKLDMKGNRGAITVNIENLGDGKAVSEVYLFKSRDEKIKIGPINSKRGRLQRSLVLNGKDEPIENYNICGVVLNDKILMYTPVFMPAQVNQLSILLCDAGPGDIIKNFEKEEKIEAENTENTENIKDIKDAENDEEIKTAEMAEDDKNVCNENILENELYENTKLDNFYEANADTINTINTPFDNVQTNSEQAKYYGRYFNNEYEKKLFTLLGEFEEVKPLANDIKSMNWWKITYDENSLYKGFLPYFNQIITTYYPYPMSNHITTCQSLLKRHGYYLFGVYEQNGKITKYVYGVPGKFTRDQQPYRGVTGFKNWSYKNNDIPGDYGYWLAFIDAGTGAVSEAPEVE